MTPDNSGILQNNPNKAVKEFTFVFLVDGMSIIQKPRDTHDNTGRSVKRYGICIKTMDVCRQNA